MSETLFFLYVFLLWVVAPVAILWQVVGRKDIALAPVTNRDDLEEI